MTEMGDASATLPNFVPMSELAPPAMVGREWPAPAPALPPISAPDTPPTADVICYKPDASADRCHDFYLKGERVALVDLLGCTAVVASPRRNHIQDGEDQYEWRILFVPAEELVPTNDDGLQLVYTPEKDFLRWLSRNARQNSSFLISLV